MFHKVLPLTVLTVPYFITFSLSRDPTYLLVFFIYHPHLFVAIFLKLLSFVRLHMLGVAQVLLGGTGVPGATP